MLRCLLMCAAGVLASGSSSDNNNTANPSPRGNQAAVPCRPTLSPTIANALITWYKDGALVDTRSERVMLRERGDWNRDMIIQPVREQDAGFYVCLATTHQGDVNGTTSLLATNGGRWLLITGPITTLSQDKAYLTYSWTCEAFGVDDVRWDFPHHLADGHAPIQSKTNRIDGRVSTNLSLQQQTDQDTVKFCLRCVGSCPNVTQLSSPCLPSRLLSPGLPKVTSGSTTTFSQVPGSTVTLPCRVTSIPPLQTIQWLKNDVVLQRTDNRLRTANHLNGGTVHHPALTLRQVNREAEGTYICTASNLVGTGNGTALVLTVQGIVNDSFTSVFFSPDSTVVLPCNVTSSSAIRVTWHKNGDVLDPFSSYRLTGGIVDRRSLTIDHVTTADSGVYICSVADRTGHTLSTKPIWLNVLEVGKQTDTELWKKPENIMGLLVGLAVVSIVVIVCCIMGRRGLLPQWLYCGTKKGLDSTLVDWKLRRSGHQISSLDVNRLRHPSVDKAILSNSKAVEVYQQRAREYCQDMIPLMDGASVKTALLSLAGSLPLHLLPFLGLASPTCALRLGRAPSPDWCLCGQCVTAQHELDRPCCGLEECVTRSPMFFDLCLKPHVLEVVGILDQRDRLGSQESAISPEMLRNQAKKFFVLWQWGNSGRRIDQIPSCVEARIRWAYPDDRLQEACT